MRKGRGVLLPPWRLRHRRINVLGLEARNAHQGPEPGIERGRGLFRPPWEDEAPPCASTQPAANEALLIPLARAQDAVARLEAAVAAAPDAVAAGLRARLALFEAAGFLAHCGSAVHPHDLALREAHLTGSYTLAALTGQLRAAAPWTTADGGGGAVADDHLVADALAYARQWRRLAELATWLPLRSLESLTGPLSQLGAPLADDVPTRAWLAALPGPAVTAGLLAAARVMAAGLPGMPRADHSRPARPTWRPRCGAGTVTEGAARCRSGRRRSRGSTRSRDKGEGISSRVTWTASPRRRGAERANSTGCIRRHAGSRPCPRAPARSCKRPARSLCASRSSPDACSPGSSMSRPAPGWISLPGWSRPACSAR